MNFISNLINKIIVAAGNRHYNDCKKYFDSLSIDDKLTIFSSLLIIRENEMVNDNNVELDIKSLRESIRDHIKISMSKGHSYDGLISYYFTFISEIVEMKAKEREEIKGKISNENKRFFP